MENNIPKNKKNSIQTKHKNYKLGYDRNSQFQLHSLMLPGTILIIVFNIVPLFGLLLAFKNYKITEGIAGVFTSDWYGWQNFNVIFGNHDFMRMLVNTLGINLIGNLITIPVTILFALLINEIVSAKFKSFVQTITYMPHFISWVVFGGIVITMLSADGGLINTILIRLNLIQEPIVFMADPNYFWPIAILSNLLKELGWGTILYTAAISGIDQEMYEAADLDGATRIQKMRHITVPSIKGTIVIMIIFAVAGIMNNNFDQIFVLQNNFNLERSEVIDTYIYKVGLQQLQFGMAAAINIFKSVLAISLLFFANKVSSKLTDSGLF
ncbi:ABC transporter permease subunit [Enterococcus casseliflavus]|uniref:ABC transporter permease n=1 Tax=Enterococcus casseliflavus TaxID=37734 RepID=UPI002FBD7324